MEFPFDFKDIIQVKFYSGEINLDKFDAKNINIEFEDLLILINKVEKEAGLGKSLHKEAFSGIDFLGDVVNFDSYIIVLNDVKKIRIFKYNFDKNFIPFDVKIREKNIDNLLK